MDAELERLLELLDRRSHELEVSPAALARLRHEVEEAASLRSQALRGGAVEAERDRLLSIIETAPDMISYASLDGRVLYMNRAARKVLGIPPDADLRDRHIPAGHPGWVNELLATVAIPTAIREGAWVGETVVLRHDGCEVPVSQLILAHRTADGTPEYLSTICRDITDRKRLEADLSAARDAALKEKSQLEAVMEALPVGVALLDAQGGSVRTNRAFEQIWSGPRPPTRSIVDYAAYRAWWADSGQPVEPEEWASAQAVLEGETVVGQAMRIERFDGSQAFVLNSGAPVRDSDGQIVGSAVALQDITPLRRAEEALVRAMVEAKAANVAKSQFLANMSHELRTPMNAIMGMTDLALREPLTPRVRDMLQTARDSSHTLLELLDDILDLSRIESGKLELERAELRLRDLLDRTLKPLRLHAEQKGLELDCTVLDDVPDRLIGDAARLRQVLVNLVGNAIKFTPAGRIEVRVALTPAPSIATLTPGPSPSLAGRGGDASGHGLPLAATDGEGVGGEACEPGKGHGEREAVLELSVSDTGIGITVEDQARIFAPFTQADASTTRQYGGTGLGLTISKRLVELMGGRIWVESRLGSGSVFHFTVRCGLQPDAREEPSAPLAPLPCDETLDQAVIEPVRCPRPCRVLLAEDSPANQKLVVYVLAQRGHSVEIADNGQLALDRLRCDDYDVVLMDVQMPVMDGFQTTAAIRQIADAEKAKVPIVALTAHALKGDAERCLAAGMDAYLSKPIDGHELVEIVERLGSKADS